MLNFASHVQLNNLVLQLPEANRSAIRNLISANYIQLW